MRRLLLAVALLSATLAITGCKRKDVKDADAGATTEESAGSSGVNNSGLQEGQALEGQEGLSGLSSNQLVVYFDFDSSEIRSDSREIIDANARKLASNSSLKVRLEGNTDERGSREYNIGLGERRAQAVRRALLLQGVTEAQISTVSYGEERPAVSGSDESAWGKNRRVEIVYGN